MSSPSDYQALYLEAQKTHQQGDNQAAIAQYARLVSRLLRRKPDALERRAELRALLDSAAPELVELLRWEKRYDQAIELQERLVALYPERALALRLHAANLKLEGGQREEGLHELREIAEADPQNIWGWIALGSGYLWLEQYEQAEEFLRRAAVLETADNEDRASAWKALFELYDVQQRVQEAIDAWEQACRLDPGLRSTLPELCAMLIYQGHYPAAAEYTQQVDSRPRQLFCTGLLHSAYMRVTEAGRAWTEMMEYGPGRDQGGYDEYAEASIRILLPARGLELIEPLIQRGEVNYRRLLIAGLAYAQQRIINRATGTLDVALRMADLQRPRRTRSGGGRRIFDERARILYGQIRLDPDVRRKLDRYFIPFKG